MGPGLSDAQHFEVTPDVLWIGTQKRSVRGEGDALQASRLWQTFQHTRCLRYPGAHRSAFARYTAFNSQISDKLLELRRRYDSCPYQKLRSD